MLKFDGRSVAVCCFDLPEKEISQLKFDSDLILTSQDIISHKQIKNLLLTIYYFKLNRLVSILVEYASSENAFVRLVTLLHPLTPHKVLTQGSQSASWLERYAVADNSETPSELRQQLAQDSNRIVRAVARV